MKKTIVTVGVLAALAMSAFAGSAVAQDKLTLKLKWVPQAQFAGYYVAASKGYYAEENLDVTIDGEPILPQAFDTITGEVFALVDRLVATATLPHLPTLLLHRSTAHCSTAPLLHSPSPTPPRSDHDHAKHFGSTLCPPASESVT